MHFEETNDFQYYLNASTLMLFPILYLILKLVLSYLSLFSPELLVQETLISSLPNGEIDVRSMLQV